MPYNFTPAAQRAMQAVLSVMCDAKRPKVELTSLLMGLLDEDECRASAMLAQAGIDQSLVMGRWPSVMGRCPNCQPGGQDGKSPEYRSWLTMDAIVESVERRLDELPRPITYSTEHLLLALVDSSSDVGCWLREQGLSASRLTAEIYRMHRATMKPFESQSEPSSPESHINCDATFLARVLDASANRATEALRVIEDYVRFGLDDQHLTSLAKGIRHELTEALAVLSDQQRRLARDTTADVGARLSTKQEYQRSSVADVVEANFSRLREALRSLEEFAKIEYPDVARGIEQLRYRVYTLHRAVGITGDSLQRLRDSRLCVLIDGCDNAQEFRSLAASLVEAGVHILQLREKEMDDRQLLARAKALREITADTPTLFIMNDRPDLAFLADADGVHVGQDELSVRDARKIVGDKLVGLSTHSIAQARQAVLDGANYIGVGPTFPSQTKAFEELSGLGFVREVAGEIALPAFAIGGVDAENATQIIEAGLQRVAVKGAVLHAPSPAQAALELLEILPFLNKPQDGQVT